MKQQELLKSANDCALKIMESVLDVEFFKEPYSHCVIDNFFPPAFAQQLFSGFPPLESEDWERTNDPEIEVKLRSAWKSEFDIPDDILPAIRILNSSMISIFFDAITVASNEISHKGSAASYTWIKL